MISFEHIIKDPMGLHARPAAELVKEAKNHKSNITITFQDKTVDAIRMMAIMRLGTKQGDKIVVNIDGEDEEKTANALKKFFEENV